MATVAQPSQPRICLNMIVKNEAHVIERCLASVLPLIDSWVIVDTGSTDATPDIIERFLRGKPGQLHHRPWLNFGHNRTEAMQLALQAADCRRRLHPHHGRRRNPDSLSGFSMGRARR
jgi:glycosyltransferase involved in cell wall biosynthesis